jgi:hypothetical protein
MYAHAAAMRLNSIAKPFPTLGERAEEESVFL